MLARAVVAGTLDLGALVRGLERRSSSQQLTALRGLGRWTADWFLARCLRPRRRLPGRRPRGAQGVRPLLRSRAVR